MKLEVLFSLVLLIIMLPFVTYGQERTLNIIYTGSMNGELESCGCSPKTDFGGVARLSGYLAAHKKELTPYILIDAGNFTAEDTPQGRLKAEAMLKSFGIMKYDAVAFLKNEKAFDHDFFSAVLKDDTILVVSDTPPGNKSVLIKRDGFNVNISIDPESYKENTLNILLTDRSVTGTKIIKGWDVIIVSSGEIFDEPVKVNETIITAGYPKGKKFGILTVLTGSEGGKKNFKHRWHPLGNDIKEDAGVRNILNDYDARVAALLRESGKPSSEITYAGVSKCAECHQLFVEGWEETRHAGAFKTLEEVGKSADPECIVCHTVGFGEEGGFYSVETTPQLVNVQCEECHGLDREHLEDYYKPMMPVTESVCLKCHTKDNSPDFDYPVYLEKIKH
jgi:hypothetical protein